LLSRKATIDTMIATTITLLVGATWRSFTFDPADVCWRRTRDHQRHHAIAPSTAAPELAAVEGASRDALAR